MVARRRSGECRLPTPQQTRVASREQGLAAGRTDAERRNQTKHDVTLDVDDAIQKGSGLGCACGDGGSSGLGDGADWTIPPGRNIVNLGNGGNTSSSISITGGGVKDRTFTVSSASGLSVNQMIELDRDDDPDVVVSTTGAAATCVR